MASSGERAVSEDDAGAEPPSSLLGWEEADRADAARIEEIAAYVAFLRRSSSTVLAAEEASEGPIATSAASLSLPDPNQFGAFVFRLQQCRGPASRSDLLAELRQTYRISAEQLVTVLCHLASIAEQERAARLLGPSVADPEHLNDALRRNSPLHSTSQAGRLRSALGLA